MTGRHPGPFPVTDRPGDGDDGAAPFCALYVLAALLILAVVLALILAV